MVLMMHWPEALTKGVSLFLIKMMMVIRVRMMPRLAMQIGKIANTDPCHIYWTWRRKNKECLCQMKILILLEIVHLVTSHITHSSSQMTRYSTQHTSVRQETLDWNQCHAVIREQQYRDWDQSIIDQHTRAHQTRLFVNN